jgi:hypothetical protein
MPASKRRRRTILPTDVLFFVAVAVTFCVVYVAALNLHEIMLEGRSDLQEMISLLPDRKDSSVTPTAGENASTLAAPMLAPDESGIDARVVLSKPSHSQDETPPPTHLSKFSEVYAEKEIALLGDDVSNTGLEAVKHTDEWKSAADWNHDFVQMNQTFNLGMDPPLPPALPAFQVLPFEVPPVQMPAFPTIAQP